MELLLNLAWFMLAAGAFAIFIRRSHGSRGGRISERRSLIALACLLLLLFPIVSASDDLHPSQALLEDATKRIQSLASPLPLTANPTVFYVTATLLALCLFPSLAMLRRREPLPMQVRTLAGHHVSRAGRAPPLRYS
jgi:hypothetical protein